MNTAATLPPGIEIFRPGRLIDDTGVEHTFSASDIAGMASAYDPALRQAPLCIGHPADNLPAYGWTSGLAVNVDGRLAMNTEQVEPQFAEMVRSGRFKKRSAAFYPPSHPNNPKPGAWYLRHVAFLGAQPPAVSGLKDIQFAEAEAGFVCFSEVGGPGQSTQEFSMEDKERLEAEARAAKEAQAKAEKEASDARAQLAQFAEQRRAERKAGFVQFAEAQLAAGKLKKPDADALPAVLEALADSQVVEFSEGGATKKINPAEWLKDFVAKGNPVVQFGEFSPGDGQGENGSTKGLSDAELDQRARAYAAKHNVNYADAISKVVSFSG